MRNEKDLIKYCKELEDKLLLALKKNTWLLKNKDSTSLKMFAKELAKAIVEDK